MELFASIARADNMQEASPVFTFLRHFNEPLLAANSATNPLGLKSPVIVEDCIVSSSVKLPPITILLSDLRAIFIANEGKLPNCFNHVFPPDELSFKRKLLPLTSLFRSDPPILAAPSKLPVR